MVSSLSTDGLEAHREFNVQLRRFQVLGERSSGTNFIASLIAKNLDITECNHLGWKHAVPHSQFIARDMLVIVAFRNPTDWLRSMHRKPWHSPPHLRGLQFSEFIRSEWETLTDDLLVRNDTMNTYRYERRSRLLSLVVWNHGFRKMVSNFGVRLGPIGLSEDMKSKVIGLTVQQDRHPISGKKFQNVVEMRTVKAQGFLGMRERGCNYLFINYEKAKMDPAGFIKTVALTFDISSKSMFIPVDEWLGGFLKTEKENLLGSPAFFSGADLQFINDFLSMGTENEMGYGLLTSL